MPDPDISEFFAELKGHIGNKMSVFMQRLPEDKRISAEAALHEPLISTSAIARVFRRWAAELDLDLHNIPKETAIRNYRREHLGE